MQSFPGSLVLVVVVMVVGAHVVAAAERAAAARAAEARQVTIQRVEPRSGWKDLEVSETTHRSLRKVASESRKQTGRGTVVLFSGAELSMKRRAAEVLAAELQLALYRVDLSTVVSEYIGETEKNLDRVFATVEQNGALLFFDEADALFGKRTDVSDSHDRYANQEVGYLLQRMESFEGLAILATNRPVQLDPALERLFRYVVEFLPVKGSRAP